MKALKYRKKYKADLYFHGHPERHYIVTEMLHMLAVAVTNLTWNYHGVPHAAKKMQSISMT
jgi:hypothetical protein